MKQSDIALSNGKDEYRFKTLVTCELVWIKQEKLFIAILLQRSCCPKIFLLSLSTLMISSH